MKQISLNGDDWLFKEFVGMDWVWRNSVKKDTRETMKVKELHSVLKVLIINRRIFEW